MDELNSLRDSLLEGGLGRREFLRKALALGISLPAAGALLSAWGRGGLGVAQAATTPKRGGVLKFARNFEPVTLGPFGAADNGTIWTIMMIYDQLVEYQAGSLDPAAGARKVLGVQGRGQDGGLPSAQREVLRRLDRHRRGRQVLARPVQGSQGQQPACRSSPRASRRSLRRTPPRS